MASRKQQQQNSQGNTSDIIMIDIESDNTQQSIKTAPILNLEEEDEWMSDENLDAKMEILKKQIKVQKQPK